MIPVDDLHPTITESNYNNYLTFYWNVTTSGFSSAYSVTHTYYYNSSDVVGSPANIERCDNATSNWSTLTGTITGASTYKFYFGTVAFLDGSYTIGDQFTGLPILFSFTTGNWFNKNTWTTDSTNTTSPVNPAVPNGHSVYIRYQHTVSLQSNNALASSAVIDGTLDAMNTTNHNIGVVSGKGRIRMTGTASGMFAFPAGTYDMLLANPNSVVEFYGSTNSTMPLSPGNVNTPYQTVLFTGTGTKYVSAV